MSYVRLLAHKVLALAKRTPLARRLKRDVADNGVAIAENQAVTGLEILHQPIQCGDVGTVSVVAAEKGMRSKDDVLGDNVHKHVVGSDCTMLSAETSPEHGAR